MNIDRPFIAIYDRDDTWSIVAPFIESFFPVEVTSIPGGGIPTIPMVDVQYGKYNDIQSFMSVTNADVYVHMMLVNVSKWKNRTQLIAEIEQWRTELLSRDPNPSSFAIVLVHPLLLMIGSSHEAELPTPSSAARFHNVSNHGGHATDSPSAAATPGGGGGHRHDDFSRQRRN